MQSSIVKKDCRCWKRLVLLSSLAIRRKLSAVVGNVCADWASEIGSTESERENLPVSVFVPLLGQKSHLELGGPKTSRLSTTKSKIPVTKNIQNHRRTFCVPKRF